METDKKHQIRRNILIEHELFYSRAFNELSKSGIITLLRCLQKRTWDKTKIHGKKQVVYSNDGFIFPYAEASFLGIKSTQHWKNIRQLIELGFLDLVYQGGWYQKHDKEKDYSVFQLSERWRKYDAPEFVKIEKPKNPYHQQKGRKLKVLSQKRKCQLHKSESDRPKTGNTRLHKSESDRETIKDRQSLAIPA